MKLIVSDMDGTLLNSNNKISAENAAALLLAQDKGYEIAIATGRTYNNAAQLCREVGLRPHIISNHGSFVYTKEGKLLRTTAMEHSDVQHVLDWLDKGEYFYDVCTGEHTYMPSNARELMLLDLERASRKDASIDLPKGRRSIEWLLSMGNVQFVDNMRSIATKDRAFGNIAAMTFDKQRLQAGRDYFRQYPGVTMTVAADDLFEMIDARASKGNALEYLADYLQISMWDIMAIGDHYNDISMLERVGFGVAIGNAKEAVKDVCQHVSLTNDRHGVAHIVKEMLPRWEKYSSCNG
ncbi:Cof-type HAD-IIB family hydrolase [Propionispora vibrioides]|uniref:Cof subfamily of IIB subfamily of haloacid dehalogenase superfamily/HAD-superfamily hydrolase, subfamily IIB n=1 Tax=Propionispora vibrioides TaxID=112903 RepID=A0A1H8QBV5_9FIRM|nr:Cof-type HAD-IIB family hydrolase [Propionispora vibrioides]SEO51692.1 hypothetical protein SAMN04490178_102260 [Propionispora vibrioides]